MSADTQEENTMNRYARPAAAAALLLALAGCTPHNGDTCNPSKDSSFLSTRTSGGKTVTTKLECKQVGINRYEWRNTK